MKTIVVLSMCYWTTIISATKAVEIRRIEEKQQLMLLEEAVRHLGNASTTLDTSAATIGSLVGVLRNSETIEEIIDPMIAPLERVKNAATDLSWSVRRIGDQVLDAITKQKNHHGRTVELLKDIDANYELFRCGLRMVMKTVNSLIVYATTNIGSEGAEEVLVPFVRTLSIVDEELNVLVGRRMVLFVTDIMG